MQLSLTLIHIRVRKGGRAKVLIESKILSICLHCRCARLLVNQAQSSCGSLETTSSKCGEKDDTCKAVQDKGGEKCDPGATTTSSSKLDVGHEPEPTGLQKSAPTPSQSCPALKTMARQESCKQVNKSDNLNSTKNYSNANNNVSSTHTNASKDDKIHGSSSSIKSGDKEKTSSGSKKSESRVSSALSKWKKRF